MTKKRAGDGKLTKSQLAAKKVALEREAKEYDEEASKKKRVGQRKTRGTFAQFKEEQRRARMAKWRWAVRLVIKKLYLKKITAAKENINQALANEAAMEAAKEGSKGGGLMSSGVTVSTMGGSSMSATTATSKAATKIITANEDIITNSHERLGKLHFDDEVRGGCGCWDFFQTHRGRRH